MKNLSDRVAALTPAQREQLRARLGSVPQGEAVTAVAVIGVGCRFPASASPEAFWQRLCEGFNAVRTVPADRWNPEEFFASDPSTPGKTNSRWGGFLDQIDLFDREFFGLTPREAVHMDPQQRLLLETTWEALEDAGQMTPALAGSATGVFIGAQSHSMDYYLLQARERERLDTYTATGTAHSILANRLSFILDLRGPSLAVDTACSSSLVAVHLACQSLRSSECDLAVAGGINLMLTPDFHICLGKLDMMAPDGLCKTFDHRADGFVRGEGCGVVILKRLADAIHDRDPILAVIRGSATNQDGASNGLTAPNGVAQEAVVRRALALSQVPPESVSYVETHGTGTALGDFIEVEALSKVLRSGGAAKNRCVLGAVKTNLGHLEAASGITGLIKAVLCLKHELIPRNLNFERLNPQFPADGLPFVFPVEPEPWPRAAEPRVAGVSSFGFGGTNAHVVLSEAPAMAGNGAQDESSDNRVHLLPISARTSGALSELAASYIEFLTTPESANLLPADIAYTAGLRRLHHDHRWCVAGAGHAEWAAALRKHLTEGPATLGVTRNAAANVVFAYSGQGSQWAAMGSQLVKVEPVFREALERCDKLFRQHASWSLIEELGAPAGSSRLDRTELAQPVLFSLQVALTELWAHWGIRPGAVVGHSVGEVAAAHAAGVLSLEDAVGVVFHRGRLMQRASGGGRMAAAGLSPLQAASWLESYRGGVCLAAVNSPSSVVFSGDSESIQNLVKDLERSRVFARVLPVDYAFHSPQMDAYGAELISSLEGMRVMSARAEIVSTVSGRFAETRDFGPAYWARNMREPVLFASAMQALVARGHRLFVEIGPHPVLCPAIAQCESPDTGPLTTVPSLRRDCDERRSLLEGLAKMQAAGCEINWRSFFPENGRCVGLPRYPWQRQRYWLSAPSQVAWADAVSERAGLIEPPADWFYEVEWKAHNNLARSGSQESALQAVELERVATSLKKRLRQLDSERQPSADLNRQLDELSVRYIWSALAASGANVSAGSRWPKAGLERELKVIPRYSQLLERLLNVISSAGVLRDEGDHWTVAESLSVQSPSWQSGPLTEQFPDARQVLRLHDRCGSRLGDMLRGHCDPLSLLFAEEEESSAESIYRDAAPSVLAHRLVAEELRDWIAQLPGHRVLRVLEVGAGTGGTTAALLPGLPADRSEYVFTDVSTLFLKRAAEKFANFPFVRYGLLDLERPPAAQGFGDGTFDLIVAANVLHATRDLALSLGHIRGLLAPGGMLLAIECTTPRPWMEITFGLTEGWWRFADRNLRESHPLLQEEAWSTLLARCGFEDNIVQPLQQSGTELFDQALIIARRSKIEARPVVVADRYAPAEYLVFADSSGLGDELTRQLEIRGDRCSLVQQGATEFAAPFENLFDHVPRTFTAVVYLAATDHDQWQASRMPAACQRTLATMQALLATGWAPQKGVWLVTRGSQPVAGTAVTSPEHALLWGLGRGVALETPELGVRLIDLDPAKGIEDSAAALLTEIDDLGSEDQIAVRRGQRYVARLTRTTISGTGSAFRVTGAHLITGGLGSLGAKLALSLASAGAEHLVLVVRRPVPEREYWESLPIDHADYSRVKIIREIEAAGARVTVQAVDLADEANFETRARSLDFTTQKLHGIWHTAMSMSSGAIRVLKPEDVSTMIRVKSVAAWRLHELSLAHQLDHFVLFSSATALWGATGLAHYAAANAFLDALAHFRRAQGLPAAAVNWGAWQQMSEPSAAEGDKAARAGLRRMPAPLALTALERILRAGKCQTTVADVDWTVFKPVYESRRTRPFLELMVAGPATESRVPQHDQGRVLVDRLGSTAPGERREVLALYLDELLAKLLGAGIGFIDRRQGFFGLGLDSLTSVQMRRRLESDLRRSLPSAVTFNYSTIDSLADYLVGELFPATPPPRSPHGPNLEGDDYAEATEEELFDRLAARLLPGQR